MFYILMAAIVAVVIFVVGYLLGKASSAKSGSDTSYLEKQVESLDRSVYHAEVALESIKNGSTNPVLEAELALNKIKTKEIS